MNEPGGCPSTGFCKNHTDKGSQDSQLYTHDLQLQTTCLQRLSGIGIVKSASRYASSNTDLVLCDVEVNVADKLPHAANILPLEVHGETSQCRVYQGLPVPVAPKTAALHLQVPYIIVANAMSPAPEHESDFNRWYDEEHLALLSQSPQWLSSKRYALLSATDGAPRYLAIHAWDGYGAFESEAYKYATNTEWKHKIVDRVLQRDREVYNFVEKICL